MKKIICALLGCFLSISVFAVQIDFTGGESTGRWYVSYETLRNVIYDENLSKISEEQAKLMLEKYWEIRSESKDDKITTNDLGKICQAGGVGAVNQDCYERIVIPLANKMKNMLRMNACANHLIPKNRAHCIGDVFTTVYNTYSPVHTPYKKNENDVLTATGDAWQAMYPHFTHGTYAQDVVVDEWTAYGFAIEYIKKHAGDVDYIFCDPIHDYQMISCVTGKNKRINDDFWTIAFRYIGTDGDAEENKIKAICALNEADFVENSCNPMPHVRIDPWDCRAGCDMECEYYNHRDLYQQIARMGLNSYGSSILTPTCRIWQDTSSASGVREYPGFEHISHVFENIQAVLNKKTVDRIKTYIVAQNIPGIGFDDIDCNWGAGGVRDGLISKVSGALLGTDPNDHKLTCLIGDKTVDIVFDDLYETNRHKLKLGSDGYKCLMVHRKTGYTQFNGEECIGVTKEQCIGSIPGKCGGLCAQVPGGTTWDDGVCILNDANLTKENMELMLKTSGEVALLFTGLGEVMLAYVAGTELFDAARKALEDEKSHRAHNHVDDFINDANKCNNKFCAKQIVTKYMHSIMQYSNDFNDDEIDNVGVAILKLRAYLTPEEFEEASNASTKMESDKFYDIASIGVFISDLFFNPNKLGKIGKVERVLSRAGIKSVERYSETLGNAKYFKVYVDGFTDAQKNNMIAIIQKKGLFVGANKTEDGRAFLAYSDKNIFGPWSNDAGNWLKNSTNVFDINMLKNKVSTRFEERLNHVLKPDTPGMEPNMVRWTKPEVTDAEWEALNKYLNKQGVEIVDDIEKPGSKIMRKIGSGKVSSVDNPELFSKVYNGMSADVLNAKLEYVYKHSGTTKDAVKALKKVGAFDEVKAAELAKDIANETVRRIKNFGGQEFINKMKNWNRLSKQDKETVMYNLHEFITTQRRNHDGNTIVDILDDADFYGQYWYPDPSIGKVKKFEYVVNRNSMKDVLNTIVHENTHALQSINKSSIHPAFVELANKNYVNPGDNYKLYFNNITEIEARYVGDNVAAEVIRQLGL